MQKILSAKEYPFADRLAEKSGKSTQNKALDFELFL